MALTSLRFFMRMSLKLPPSPGVALVCVCVRLPVVGCPTCRPPRLFFSASTNQFLSAFGSHSGPNGSILVYRQLRQEVQRRIHHRLGRLHGRNVCLVSPGGFEGV